jgi:AraC-like DNA-binding protein
MRYDYRKHTYVRIPDALKGIQIDGNFHALKEGGNMTAKSRLERIEGASMFHVTGPFGSLFFQTVSLDNTVLWLNHFAAERNCSLLLPPEKHMPFMYLVLGGSIDHSISGMPGAMLLPQQFNCFYLPRSNMLLQLKAGCRYAQLLLCFDTGSIPGSMYNLPTCSSLLNAMEGQQIFIGLAKYLPLHVLQIIHAIRKPVYEGDRQQAYLGIKVKELLFCLLAVQEDPAIDRLGLTAEWMQQLQAVKDFIAVDFLHHHSIKELSKRCRTNTASFKNGFKQAFGMGPFEWLVQVRMEHALALLGNNKLTINQVADKVGYETMGGFVKAFRQHYGCTPVQARKR